MRTLLLIGIVLLFGKSFCIQKDLFDAIDKNDDWVLEHLIITHKIDLNAPDMVNQYGEPPIVYAAIKNSYAIVKMLLQYGAYINAKSKVNGQTPLYHTLNMGNFLPDIKLIELLLQRGAHNSNYPGGTLINYCFGVGSAEFLLLLLKYGFSPNTRCTDLKKPLLCYAIDSWKTGSNLNERGKKIIYLLEWGADPYKKAKVVNSENFFELKKAWYYPRSELEIIDTNKFIAICEANEPFYKLLRQKLKEVRKLKRAERHAKTRNFITHPIKPIDLEKIKEEVAKEMRLEQAEDFIRNSCRKYIEEKLLNMPHVMPAMLYALQANTNLHAVASVRCPVLYSTQYCLQV